MIIFVVGIILRMYLEICQMMFWLEQYLSIHCNESYKQTYRFISLRRHCATDCRGSNANGKESMQSLT